MLISLVLFGASALSQGTDSLKVVQQLDTLNTTWKNSLDSLQKVRVEFRKQGNLPKNKMDSLINVLNAQSDSIQSKINTRRQKLNDLSNKPQQWLDSLGSGINSKVAGVSNDLSQKLGVDQVSSELEGVSAPEVDESIGELGDITKELGGTELGLDKIDSCVPGVEEVNKSLDINAESALDEIDVDKSEIDGLLNSEEIQEVKTEVEKMGQEVTGYTQIDSAAVQNRIKQELSNSKEYQEFLKNEAAAGDLEKVKQEQVDLLEKPMNELNLESPEEIKQRIAEKSKKIANDQLSDQQDKFQFANEKLDKYKVWYKDAKSVKKLKLGIFTPTGKTLFQKMSLTSDFEIISINDVVVDIAPGLDYRLTQRLILGANHLRRVGQNLGDSHYGFREYLGFRIKPEFEGILVYEQIRSTEVSETSGISRREWSPALQIGLRKKATLKKLLKFQFTLLYNFSRINDEAYDQPINVRLGFYKMLKK
ncbi:MAG: hypothetical protein AAF843_10375 [Bacteroidota bacterium]